ncbi:hypothetical protein DXG03_005083 [Asterophora parasitica]|uniref:FHA domain-containing protein n=1 Tax=Asterophora parasitica TaxID=117018 RepID=A0A9P7G0N5_9AGAR|nr:hypothetical protein DXG03_005083 [Asterophora parasitica]
MASNGFCQIGRYGTISLMKRGDPSIAVTAFGIDTDQLTFGRDPTCGVRLYYTDVGLVHCKIVFEEHKAFLVVLGSNGLFVDGCKVYPSSTPASETTIPLTNNSEFEIHGKRFKFTYPPKDLRPALYASPARSTNRALRLSMIQSTQVFSLRPSPDPRENLRILKSPLKNTFKSAVAQNLFAAKYAYESPAKRETQDDEEDSIILVDGNHPRVVEDEKDLVILEDVEMDTETEVPPAAYTPQPQIPPQTPARKRSLSRNTLHRAVLIRSAQRAVLKAELDEREREQEEEEEMEVFDAVASEPESGSDEEEYDEDEYEEEEIPLAGSDDVKSEEEQVVHRGRTEDRKTQKLGWRKSLERLWPFRSSSAGPEEGEVDDDENGENSLNEMDQNETEEQERNENEDTLSQQTSERRTLGSFMTPQIHPRSKVSSSSSTINGIDHPAGQPDIATHTRYSLGGEARRVARTEQVWKVQDIIVPEGQAASALNDIKAESANPVFDGLATPRKVVDAEERKAIQERRRSAVREVGANPFFPGGVPGMGSGSPIKPLGWTPARTSGFSSTIASMSSRSTSPSKSTAAMIKREGNRDDDEAEEAIDTRCLLERMKETVEGMKRRQSLAPPATPARGGNALTTPARERVSLSFVSRTSSPSKSAAVTMLGVAEEEEGEGEEKETIPEDAWEAQDDQNGAEVEHPVFSLLRPGVLEAARAKGEEENVLRKDEAHSATVAEVEDDVAMDTTEDLPGRLVTTIPVLADEEPPVIDDVEVDMEKEQTPALPSTLEESSVGEVIAPRPEVKSNLNTPARRSKVKVVEGEDDTATTTAHDKKLLSVPNPNLAVRRGHRAAAQSEESDKVTMAPPALLKRVRKAVAPEVEEPPPAVAPVRRGRKATVESEEVEEKVAPVYKGRKPVTAATPATETEPGAPAPTRRTARKAAIVPDAEDVTEPTQRRGRAPKAAAATSIPVRRNTARGKAAADESSVDASGSGTTRRGTKTAHGNVEDEADPLNSIEAEESVAAKPKGRKKVVKEEVVEEPLEAVPTRSRAKSAALKTPVVKDRATSKKTPATAPAAVQQVNKENSGATSVQGDDEELVKVRVSRTTRKMASGTTALRSAKVKREESEEEIAEAEAPRSRVMRATRARTRT